MGKTLRIRHQYHSGDLITMLPGLKNLFLTNGIKTTIYQELNLPAPNFQGHEHPVKNENGEGVCMNKATFDLIYPLIMSQEYIEDFIVWEGQEVDRDMFETRDSRVIPLPFSSIFHWPMFVFPDLHCDLSQPWVYLPDSPNKDYLSNKILVGRTDRYTNPHISYYFLKEHEQDVLFIGLPKECDKFNKQFNLNLGFLMYDNFYGYAQAIKNCRFYVGNQSLFWQIANSISKLSILEVSNEYPNTLPTHKNGYAVLYQYALEHIFRNLENHTKTP